VSLTKSKLIDIIADRADVSRKRAEKVVNTVFGSMAEGLVEGRRIEMRGFGSFTVKQYPAYVGRNPRTGKQVPVPAKRAIKFKVGKDLATLVNDTK
jgi:integration host factor subunit beta